METKQYRVKHTIYGLKPNPQEPTLAPALVDLDEATAAHLLAANAVEELAGDDLLAQAAAAEQEAEQLRQQAAQKKARAELLDRIQAAPDLAALDILVPEGTTDEELLASKNKRHEELNR